MRIQFISKSAVENWYQIQCSMIVVYDLDISVIVCHYMYICWVMSKFVLLKMNKIKDSFTRKYNQSLIKIYAHDSIVYETQKYIIRHIHN